MVFFIKVLFMPWSPGLFKAKKVTSGVSYVIVSTCVPPLAQCMITDYIFHLLTANPSTVRNLISFLTFHTYSLWLALSVWKKNCFESRGRFLRSAHKLIFHVNFRNLFKILFKTVLVSFREHCSPFYTLS